MRRKSPVRVIVPDEKYQRPEIGKFINYVMQRGKKSTARQIVYDCLTTVEEKSKKEPIEVFEKALKNIAPEVEVRSRRIGGGNYQVPVPVQGNRKTALAFRWLIAAANSRKGMPMSQKLATEILDASENTGAAVKKREDTYRMAEANRAFAHFGRPRRKKK